MQQVNTLGILGAGQMGGGIAQIAAAAGLKVLFADINLDVAQAGKTAIEKRLAKLVQKGKLASEEMTRQLGAIEPVASLENFASVDMAIEAASENIDLKKKLFQQLDSVCKPEAIIATNTSSISITLIAAETSRPEQVVGMHFFNPVPAMKLVEVIRGLATNESTFNATKELAERLGKQVVDSDDKPGFTVNRILVPMINEACFVLDEGIASVEDIDAAMQLGANHPMGPLTLADFIGLDTILAVMEVLHKELGDDKYRPAPLLRNYVAAGWLGKKSGRGFYQY